MCLLIVAQDCVPGYRLVVAANRDEFHVRPTAAAARWRERPDIVAGRDLESGGTWLGLSETGRFATVTNVRAGHRVPRGARSRGLIVTDFLQDDVGAGEFTRQLAACGRDYDGFNVIAYDGMRMSWYSNQAEGPLDLGAGLYALSNAQLDTPWPKTERLRQGFTAIVEEHADAPVETLLALLRDDVRAPEPHLPDTGIGRDMERVLSSIFVEGASYGTRCSTVLTIDHANRVRFHERRFDAAARVTGDSRFEFELRPAAA